MPVKIKDGQTILFIGDSITDCGRRDDSGRPLGHGYVRMFRDMLLIREPRKTVKVINKGIGGNTIEALRNRWSDDVITHRPDWLSVKIGINDLHMFIGGGAEHLSPAGFEKIYDQVLGHTKKKLPRCSFLLIHPFYMSRGDDLQDSQRKKVIDILPEYLAVVNRLSRKYGTGLVKTHELFQSVIKYQDPDMICPEPVHPYPAGHLLIAEGVYTELSR